MPPDPIACPCGLGRTYDACCGRFHRGEADAPTAEALMRSRYSAFAVGDEAYLRASWHPTTCPKRIHVGTGRVWTLLEVLDRTGGGLLDAEGEVEFRAHHDGGTVHERSRFVRHDGRWVYVDGVEPTDAPGPTIPS